MRIIKKRGERNVFYAVFGPFSISMPERHRLIPYGILHLVAEEGMSVKKQEINTLWKNYITESFDDGFERDFMNREMSAYFYFSRGKAFILSGRVAQGLKYMQLASNTGYDDTLIHSDMAVFLTNTGFFEEARQELEKALVYNEDMSGVHNNWGYYYHKIGDYDEAAASFLKALQLKPNRFGCYNNLGFALYEAGKKGESLIALKKSLTINPDQPTIHRFIKKHLINKDSVK
jgi:Tfp pilus assembly protein PilF